MTLVVARKIGSEIRMFSDAKLSSPNQLRTSPLLGALKIVAINDVCIAYAGTYTYAVDALREIKRLKEFDVGRIIELLMTMHKKSNNEVDFIVASYIPTVRIVRISDGKVELDKEFAWIGDLDAFSEYQRIYHSLPSMPTSDGDTKEKYEKSNTFSKMDQALSSIVREQKIVSVGQFTISVYSTSSGFKYLGNAMTSLVSQELQVDTPTLLKFGSAAQGGYSYSVLTPDTKNVGVIGVHFHQGDLGALYHPLESDKAVIYPGKTFDQFKEVVSNDFNLNIDGFKIS